jgi:hypothetical protein
MNNPKKSGGEADTASLQRFGALRASNCCLSRSASWLEKQCGGTAEPPLCGWNFDFSLSGMRWCRYGLGPSRASPSFTAAGP